MNRLRVSNSRVNHSLKELQVLIQKQPIRTAQRILRIFGYEAEYMVIMYFPEIKEREQVLKELKAQRERWAIRCWNKGYVRSY